MATVEASMSFLELWPSTEEKESPYLRGIVEDHFPSTNFTNEEHTVQVADARPRKERFTLDEHGFSWRSDINLSVDVLKAIRSKEKARVAEAYYPLVEKLLKDATSATRIIIFDHTYRKRNPALNMKENPNGKEQPATMVSRTILLVK